MEELLVRPDSSNAVRTGTGAERRSKVIVLENSPERQFKELPNARFGGMIYYDFRDVTYISNCGMARLIEHVKLLLEKGIEIRLINISDKLKTQISSLGLDHVIHCN